MAIGTAPSAKTQHRDQRSKPDRIGIADATWQRIESHLTPVDTPLGQVVYEAGDRLDHIYFPSQHYLASTSWKTVRPQRSV